MTEVVLYPITTIVTLTTFLTHATNAYFIQPSKTKKKMINSQRKFNKSPPTTTMKLCTHFTTIALFSYTFYAFIGAYAKITSLAHSQSVMGCNLAVNLMVQATILPKSSIYFVFILRLMTAYSGSTFGYNKMLLGILAVIVGMTGLSISLFAAFDVS